MVIEKGVKEKKKEQNKTLIDALVFEKLVLPSSDDMSMDIVVRRDQFLDHHSSSDRCGFDPNRGV